MNKLLLAHFMITLFFSSSSSSAARDNITPSEPLADDAILVSDGGTFALGFFTPVNSMNRYVGMWYNKVADRRVVWVANRENPVVNSAGLLSVAPNGTMMITDRKTETIVWSVHTAAALTGAVAQLLDTGNFVLKEGQDVAKYSWQSFEHPTDTLLAGMKLGLNWITGARFITTSWKRENDPSKGQYHVVMESDTNIYLYSFSRKVWRSGPWDGMNLRRSGLDYKYVNNSRESTLSFQASGDPMILTFSLRGTIQLLAASSDSGRWDLLWEEPDNLCNTVGYCGSNGICDIEGGLPVCSCLPGHVPKNPRRWGSADWADGCVRKTGLDCRNATDGFAVVSGTKLPESATWTPTARSLDECRLVCLRNCSCTAYAIDGRQLVCVIWFTDLLTDSVRIKDFEQDLYVRAAAADLVSVSPTQRRKSKNKLVAILISSIFGALACVTACVVCVLRRRKTMRRVSSATKFCSSKPNESSVDVDIPLFDFRTIEAATNSFSVENELGKGGFGTVYKGVLGDGQIIAVKRLAMTSQQGIDEFKNEVKLIAKLQNVNLVKLLGCCIQGEERMLIYEYMSNKSLDAILFDKEKCALLSWKIRYQIIIGIARGLLYLHHDSLFRVIHRDLKASNILLDDGMKPKISDFGMARLFGGDETDFNTRKIVGTYGYMSPEYAMEGIFSMKSDVFSFGVLILEIISGKKNRGTNAPSPYLNLVGEVWSLWTEGESLKIVDESMGEDYSENDVLRYIKVGLLCVQENAEDRPLMSSVIVMLGADVASLPEPKQPGFAARIGQFELDRISNKHGASTPSELTITILEGR